MDKDIEYVRSRVISLIKQIKDTNEIIKIKEEKMKEDNKFLESLKRIKMHYSNELHLLVMPFKNIPNSLVLKDIDLINIFK